MAAARVWPESVGYAVQAQALWEGSTSDGRRIGDAEGVLELLWLLATTVRAWVRPRQDLVREHLLLRHQLVS